MYSVWKRPPISPAWPWLGRAGAASPAPPAPRGRCSSPGRCRAARLPSRGRHGAAPAEGPVCAAQGGGTTATGSRAAVVSPSLVTHLLGHVSREVLQEIVLRSNIPAFPAVTFGDKWRHFFGAMWRR